MLGGYLFEIMVILLLLVANGFFAAAEIAVVSARKGRLEQRAEEGVKGAVTALALRESPDRFLSTVQIGITLIGTLAAAFGGDRLAVPLGAALAEAIPALTNYAHAIALALVVVVLSYLSLVIGELVPKRLALQNAESTAIGVAPVLQSISRLAAPVVTFLTNSAELVLRVLGRNKVPGSSVTEDDILALVREGAAGGAVEANEQDLISGVFTFTDRMVRSLMTPRTQMAALDVETSASTVLPALLASGYSRLPIYVGTLDHITGVLYLKDWLVALESGDEPALRSVIRSPLYVLEGQRAAAAFQQLRQSHQGLAIVLDEYGQVAGLLTIEDLLEALVGDLGDEYGASEQAIVQREDGSYLVDGLLPFDELQRRLDLRIPPERVAEHAFETVAGLVLALLGRIPTVGDQVTLENYTFEVVDMDGRRIDKVLLRAASPNA